MSALGNTQLDPLRAPLADTHAHLDMLDDPVGALVRAGRAGVSLVVTVVDPTEEPEKILGDIVEWRSQAEALSDADAARDVDSAREEVPDVRVIVGAHPHNAKDFDDRARRFLLESAGLPLVAGVGEIGLDYHYDHSPRKVQRAVFADQLGLASSLALPVAIHLREAHADGASIMEDSGLPPEGCVLHCFTADAETVDQFLAMGCYVSFAGPVTFKKADAIRDALVHVPLDRLLVETDCPFMTPEPHRGRPNEPSFVTFTARKVAEVLGMSEEDVASSTSDNARRLFGGARH